MARRCLILDLHDDPQLIAAYRDWHRPGRTPPAVIQAIRDGGVELMEIYLSGDRLVMIVETNGAATAPPGAAARDRPTLADWETHMDAFQKPVAWAAPGEKWTPAEKIFDLKDHAADGT